MFSSKNIRSPLKQNEVKPSGSGSCLFDVKSVEGASRDFKLSKQDQSLVTEATWRHVGDVLTNVVRVTVLPE